MFLGLRDLIYLRYYFMLNWDDPFMEELIEEFVNLKNEEAQTLNEYFNWFSTSAVVQVADYYRQWCRYLDKIIDLLKQMVLILNQLTPSDLELNSLSSDLDSAKNLVNKVKNWCSDCLKSVAEGRPVSIGLSLDEWLRFSSLLYELHTISLKLDQKMSIIKDILNRR